MSVSVPLEFIPPIEPGFTKLHILEGPSPTDQFVEIDLVTNVGTYPDYITRWTTTNAITVDDWFAIFWEDDRGGQTEVSAPIKGGTKTLVGAIVDRVLLRDEGANEQIVAEEAEAIIYRLKKVDPYTLTDDDVSFRELKAMTDLTLIATKWIEALDQSSTANSYTAGIVSEKSNTNSSGLLNALKALERKALAELGLGGSLIGQLVDRTACSITGEKTVLDKSRLLAVTAIITEEMVAREIV